ncbi:MAG: VOC family protein [Hyphomicrobiales bacterium]
MNTEGKFPQTTLHHMQLTAEKPKRLADFYGKVLKMDVSEVAGGYLCQGPNRRVFFTEGPKRKTGYCAFSFDSPEALADYRTRVEAAGTETEASPSPIFNETAFAVRDPDGNLTVFGHAPGGIEESGDEPDARLQHVTLRTLDLPPMIEHYSDRLGFFLADVVTADSKDDLRTAFFASDPEHHSLAAFKSDEARLDHHSYELSGWDQIRNWADHFSSLGLSLRWGPGRHGPGNNLFIFLEDPEGNWIELSAELEVMDETRETGNWPHSARSLNLWGDAIMRS